MIKFYTPLGKVSLTNDYFARSSDIFNSSLATMSMSFAWSAFGSSDGNENDYSNKSKNAKELFANPDVDGGLIGGASLKADDFATIITSF